ncbi:MAG: phosphatase PAP2 family protein [Firmicutes bacterium]|jgi:membrane-associated phospholipid phosphatase|nr:phosphatase PAP2 family protein [Bacillota bacterium]
MSVTPVLNWFLVAVTLMGNAAVLTAIALTVYWCGDRVRGMRVTVVLFLSMWLNSVLKLVFKLPRPETVGLVGPGGLIDSGGYGFPSGHAQGVATLWWTLGCLSKSRPLLLVTLVLTAAVAASRVFLGVHFPVDVVAGGALGLGVAALAAAVIEKAGRKGWGLSGVRASAALAAASLCMMLGPVDESVSKSAGFLFGFGVGSPLEPARWGVRRGGPVVARAARAFLGIAVVLGVSRLLRTPVPGKPIQLFASHAATGATAALLVPALLAVARAGPRRTAR